MKVDVKIAVSLILLVNSFSYSEALGMLWRYVENPANEQLQMMKYSEKKPMISYIDILMADRKKNRMNGPTDDLADEISMNYEDDDGISTSIAINTNDDEIVTDTPIAINNNPKNDNKNELNSPFTDDIVDENEETPIKTIHIIPKPKIISMHVVEFHQCVSCNVDGGARRDYDQCLRELSEENKKLAKTCCQHSFRDDFCDKAAIGNVDYKTICLDPKKALEAGDCFWRAVNKDTDNIKKYRECKRRILDRYCTFKSSSESDLHLKDEKLTNEDS